MSQRHCRRRSQKTLPMLALAGLVLTTACQSTPDGQDAAIATSLTQMALTAERTNDYSGAVDQYKKLLNRNPKSTDFLIALARNLRYLGKSRDALEVLKGLRPPGIPSIAYRLELAKSDIAAGKAVDAIAVLDLARAQAPNNWEIYSTLGIAHDLNEDYAKAGQAYQQAQKLSEDNPAILNNMAISAALSGDIDKAISLLQNAPRLARHSPQMRQNLAFFYGIKGDMTAAKSLAKMDLDDAAVRKNLAIYSRFHKKKF